MVKYSSLMTDNPEKRQIMGSASYCVLSFALIPYLMSLFGFGFSMSTEMLLWAELGYHAVNFLVAVVIFREHLKYSWMNVSLNFKMVMGSAAVAALIIAGWGFLSANAAILMNNSGIAECTLPITEMTFFATSALLVNDLPIVGTICFVLMAPFAVSLLYYGTVFSPICINRPKLAYLVTALVLAIPHAVNAVTFWDPMEQLWIYLVQLPVHLIACRLYQKTDTIWAPIFAHMLVNLAACAVWILLYVI